MQVLFEVLGVQRIAGHHCRSLALHQAGPAQPEEDLLVGAGAGAQDAGQRLDQFGRS